LQCCYCCRGPSRIQFLQPLTGVKKYNIGPVDLILNFRGKN
jgi:hypothetical protein